MLLIRHSIATPRELLQPVAQMAVLVFLALLMIAKTAICQTFQYSRGWTNGKRSEFPVEAAGLVDPADEQRFVNGNPKRLRMLVHGYVHDQQPLLFHCDFADKQRKLVHTDNYVTRLRHEKEQNDDNY